MMRGTTVAGDGATADPPLMAQTAAWQGIVPEGIGAAFVDGGGEHALRLSFSSVPTTRIHEGIRRLAAAITTEQRRPARGRLLDPPGVPVVTKLRAPVTSIAAEGPARA